MEPVEDVVALNLADFGAAAAACWLELAEGAVGLDLGLAELGFAFGAAVSEGPKGAVMGATVMGALAARVRADLMVGAGALVRLSRIPGLASLADGLDLL